jgi:hypothetical protein
MWRWLYATSLVVVLVGCCTPEVITNTRSVEVVKRDTVISVEERVVRDTVELLNDTILFRDRVVVKLVNDGTLTDSLRAVISDLNLQLEVICPEEEKVVQIEEKTVVTDETVIEEKPDFFEANWWKILLGLFVLIILGRFAKNIMP